MNIYLVQIYFIFIKMFIICVRAVQYSVLKALVLYVIKDIVNKHIIMEMSIKKNT